VAVLAEDSLLGIDATLPLVVGGLQGEVAIVVEDLVAAGTEVRLQMERRFDALVEAAAALLGGLEGARLTSLAPSLVSIPG